MSKNNKIPGVDYLVAIKSMEWRELITATQVQLKVGRPIKTVRYELNKLVKSGELIKITINGNKVKYKLK